MVNMDAKQALKLKQARETTLVDIDAAIPKGRKSGELSQLVTLVNTLHKLLTRYDGMESPPAIAENAAEQFAAYVARIEELIASTEG